MSKRKVALSYSTLRRQIRTQVHADMHSVKNDDCRANDDDYYECIEGRDSLSDIGTFSVCTAFRENIEVGNETADNNSTCIQLTNSAGPDFVDADWVDSDTDTDTGEEATNGVDVADLINKWANKYNISHVSLTELMRILTPYLPVLPSCSRTLLHTPRFSNVTPLNSGGEYCHLGLAKSL